MLGADRERPLQTETSGPRRQREHHASAIRNKKGQILVVTPKLHDLQKKGMGQAREMTEQLNSQRGMKGPKSEKVLKLNNVPSDGLVHTVFINRYEGFSTGRLEEDGSVTKEGSYEHHVDDHRLYSE